MLTSAIGSNIADAEVDLYGGIAPIWKNSPFGDVTFNHNLGFIYYIGIRAANPSPT